MDGLQKPTPFISSDQIAIRVRELGAKISADYAGKEITGIANGAHSRYLRGYGQYYSPR